jgi:protein phosphatase 2C family protein 2/3
MNAAEFRGPGVHHRIDDDPDDIDMDLDSRFKPNSSLGGRIILLGDGTEISTDAQESEVDQEGEDRDLVSQVNRYNQEEPNGKAPHVTESPSSVQTEKSDSPEHSLKDAQGSKKPVADTAQLK